MSAPMISATSVIEAARNLRKASEVLTEMAEGLSYEKGRPLRDLANECRWSAAPLESAFSRTRVELVGSVDEVAA